MKFLYRLSLAGVLFLGIAVHIAAAQNGRDSFFQEFQRIHASIRLSVDSVEFLTDSLDKVVENRGDFPTRLLEKKRQLFVRHQHLMAMIDSLKKVVYAHRSSEAEGEIFDGEWFISSGLARRLYSELQQYVQAAEKCLTKSVSYQSLDHRFWYLRQSGQPEAGEVALFKNVPDAALLTLLAKIQYDIKPVRQWILLDMLWLD